jgi:hypothetical protein
MEEMLLEDILNHINCQQGDRNEMTGAGLEDWYIWYDYCCVSHNVGEHNGCELASLLWHIIERYEI